jgi:hypothetical protein
MCIVLLLLIFKKYEMRNAIIFLLATLAFSAYGQQSKSTPGRVLDSAGNVSIVTVFHKQKMTGLDGYTIEGYVFNLSDAQVNRADGKKIEIRGRYVVNKGLKNLPEEHDKNGTVIYKQGREDDYKYIDNPEIVMNDAGDKAPDFKYKYADGNGNLYLITPDSIRYIPVTPEQSSSGKYSGGEPVAKKISEEDFQQISLVCKTIFGNKTIQSKDRVMATGELSAASPGQINTIRIDSKEVMTNLEGMLKQLLKQ